MEYDYDGAKFGFLVPDGWKAQKKPEGIVLTHSSIPGYIVVATLKDVLNGRTYVGGAPFIRNPRIFCVKVW